VLCTHAKITPFKPFLSYISLLNHPISPLIPCVLATLIITARTNAAAFRKDRQIDSVDKPTLMFNSVRQYEGCSHLYSLARSARMELAHRRGRGSLDHSRTARLSAACDHHSSTSISFIHHGYKYLLSMTLTIKINQKILFANSSEEAA
jgi:hypothetical protein